MSRYTRLVLLRELRGDTGRQPAITAFIATFSTVHGVKSGGTVAIISSGARLVPCSIARTFLRLEVRPVSRLSNRGGT